jgi:predicted GNAT family N-acyltransferase
MDPQDFSVDPADFATDLADLRLVRETVFVHEQNVPLEEEWDALDPQCRHVLARDLQRRPIGTGRLTPEKKIGRMAVLREWRGRGVGDALLVALMDQARALGWVEVSLHAQVSAEAFYARHGFEPYGPRFEEADIEHQAMRRRLEPIAGPDRPGPKPRPPSRPAGEVDGLPQAIEATIALVADARRILWIYTRDLEPALYGNPAVFDALRTYATSGRGGVVQVIVQEPALLPSSGHPLIGLAQRLTSVFQFRTPTEQVDQQYPSAFVGNDSDGFLFRLLGSRWDGEWSESLPARNRQLREHFGRVWERSRECTELRSLGI